VAATIAIACAGCGDDVEIYKPVGRGNDDPYLPQTSPESVIHNLALSYNLWDCERYEELLHNDFVFIFNQDDVEKYPDQIPPAGHWGYQDEVQATCNLLDKDYEPIDPSYKVDDVRMQMELYGSLEPTVQQGAPEGTLEGYVTLDLAIGANEGQLDLMVTSRPLFFFAPDDTQSTTTWRIWKCEDSSFYWVSLGCDIYPEPNDVLRENSAGHSAPRSVLRSGLPRVTGVDRTSWGRIKAFYRGVTLNQSESPASRRQDGASPLSGSERTSWGVIKAIYH
jgi:hypothetical protein